MPDEKQPETIADLIGIAAKRFDPELKKKNAQPQVEGSSVAFEKQAKTYLAGFEQFIRVAQKNGAAGLSDTAYAFLYSEFTRWKQGKQ